MHFSRSIMRGMRRDGFDVAGVAHLIVSTTVLGYAVMTLRELAKGWEPRDPKTPCDYGRPMMAVMAQGGGLGLYGDFLFGEANRFGDGPIASMLGPTVGTAEDLGNLLRGIRDGTASKTKAFNLAKNNTPFLNLLYTRAALDYLVFYRLQEIMNPGYLWRMECRVQQQNNQAFWLSPSAVVH